jgi:hypothetical protein
MPIIVPKYYINIREHRGGKCEVSNPPVMHFEVESAEYKK